MAFPSSEGGEGADGKLASAKPLEVEEEWNGVKCCDPGCLAQPPNTRITWKKGKDPHPQDKIQHLDFTKDPRPLYYKTPPCAIYHKTVRSKAVFGP